MLINKEDPIISYSRKGVEFQYEKILLKTLSKYIKEYKNCSFDRLTEKDQSIALARIIKKMECNGVPVLEFFQKELTSWDGLENSQRIANLLEIVTVDIFSCFDKNKETEESFWKGSRIYCINNDGEKDYIAYRDPKKRGLFSRKKEKSEHHKYFADLIQRSEAGELATSTE